MPHSHPAPPRIRSGPLRPARHRRAALVAAGAIVSLGLLPVAASALVGEETITVAAGQTYTVSGTVQTERLVVEEGATIVGADGDHVTLTVDGVETGQVYPAAVALGTVIEPGTYAGDVVLTATDPEHATFEGVEFEIRQALLVRDGAILADSSVASAWRARTATGAGADGLDVVSRGAGFGALRVDGGTYELTDARIVLEGNGRSDFAGVAAAVVGEGEGTTVVVDGAEIDTAGVLRGGVTSTDGANVVVKNSTIAVADGDLPPDYVSTVDLGKMSDAPWMLGITGNNRATLLLGTESRAAYVASTLSAQAWGVLSTDVGSDVELTVINTDVSTRESGYGAYAIGNAWEDFLGTDFDVTDYAVILTHNEDSIVRIGDSTPAEVARLNAEREIGLSEAELDALEPRSSTIASERFGFMWHGGGNLEIGGGTTVSTGDTVFQDKGTSSLATIVVDGSEGATISSGTGVLLQVMENDDPGPVVIDGELVNQGVYEQPAEPPARDAEWDLAATDVDSATLAEFSGIELEGDVYNAARTPKNLVLTLTDSTLTGVVSASSTVHRDGVTTIDAGSWQAIGEVENTAEEAVNNGVILELDGSTWEVTDVSYLTSLTLEGGAEIVAASGSGGVVVTVDGEEVDPEAGITYTGDIVVTPVATAPSPEETGTEDGTEDSTEGESGTSATTGTSGQDEAGELPATGTGLVAALATVASMLVAAGAVLLAARRIRALHGS